MAYDSIGQKNLNYKTAVIYAVLICYTVICLYPIYFSVISSLKKDTDIFVTPFTPSMQLHWENYFRAWQVGQVSKYFLNSVILTVATVIITAVIGSLAAYILAKFSFRLKNLIYILIIAGMMIPIQTTIIPLAFLFGKFQLTDNYPVLILLFVAFSIPMSVFILTGFMKSIPCELEEAAVIDGCSAYKTYSSIIIPISMPAIATVSIFNFLGVWNNLIFPLIFTSRDELKTLSIGLLSFYAAYQSDISGIMAAIVIAIVPPIAAYILLMEKVERGLTAGAIKG